MQQQDVQLSNSIVNEGIVIRNSKTTPNFYTRPWWWFAIVSKLGLWLCSLLMLTTATALKLEILLLSWWPITLPVSIPILLLIFRWHRYNRTLHLLLLHLSPKTCTKILVLYNLKMACTWVNIPNWVIQKIWRFLWKL